MDILLITITGLSLAMALAMAALVLKLLREERRRSDARVATLIELAGDTATRQPHDPAARPHAARDTAHLVRDTSAAVRHTADAAPRASHAARHTAHVAPPVAAATSHGAGDPDAISDLDLRPWENPGELFATPVRSSPWRARLAVAAGLAVGVAAGGYLLLPAGSPSRQPDALRATGTAAAAAPLELLSLRHTQENARLAVSGLVQNPRAGAPLTRVIATAIAFGADGSVLASGRAPLDFTMLAPGTESPFVVHIPVTGAVARYRIGFRAEDGEVIAHVDRRGAPDAVARQQGRFP